MPGSFPFGCDGKISDQERPHILAQVRFDNAELKRDYTLTQISFCRLFI